MNQFLATACGRALRRRARLGPRRGRTPSRCRWPGKPSPISKSIMSDQPLADPAPPFQPSLTELFTGFALVSLSGFGGALPWARRMIVERRQWMTAEEFNETFSLSQFLPGPNLVNFCVVFGSRFDGGAGAAVDAGRPARAAGRHRHGACRALRAFRRSRSAHPHPRRHCLGRRRADHRQCREDGRAAVPQAMEFRAAGGDRRLHRGGLVQWPLP